LTALERDEAWTRLRQAGLVQGDPPPPDPASSPWYVRVMLGVAGWIGAFFLLAFVGAVLSFLFREALIGIAAGLACCVAAYALLRAKPRNDFLVQFALAISLAGQVLFVTGVMQGGWEHGGPRTGRLLVVALFEAGLAIAMPLFIHRVWSSWAAVFAFAMAMGQMSIGAMVPAFVSAAAAALWLTEFSVGRHSSLSRAAAYGLSLALLQFQGLAAWGLGSDLANLSTRQVTTWEPVASAALLGAVLVFVAWRLLIREGAGLPRGPALAALGIAVLVAIIGMRMPGLAAAAMLAVLGFANGNRVLLGLGLFGLIGFVSSYYYRLDVTLLAKSGYLAAAGVVLLVVRQALVGLFGNREPRPA
jgi:hypothetical protein